MRDRPGRARDSTPPSVVMATGGTREKPSQVRTGGEPRSVSGVALVGSRSLVGPKNSRIEAVVEYHLSSSSPPPPPTTITTTTTGRCSAAPAAVVAAAVAAAATATTTITTTTAAGATTAAIARSKKGSGDDTTQRGRVCRLLLQSFARHTAKRFALCCCCCCCWLLAAGCRLPTVDCFSQSAGRPRARLVSTDESARREANAEFSWKIDDRRRRESTSRARH